MKTGMTLKHKQKYNALLASLRYISNHHKTLNEAKLYCSKRGLDYHEYLQMVHDEVKHIADEAIENMKYLPLSSRTKD